jgi:ATP-binding cassette subfamily B protein
MSDGARQQGWGPPTAPGQRLSYPKLFRWSIKVVSLAPRHFICSVLIAIAALLLTQAAGQVVADIIGALRGADAPSGAQIDSSVVWLAGLFLLLTVLRTAADIGGKIVGIISDSRMLQNLQQNLHDRILSQGSEYHDRHDVSETSTVVLMDAAGAQAALREFIASPLTQGIGLVTALLLLYHNLSQLGGAPWWFRALLLASALLIPAIGTLFTKRLGAVSFAARQSSANLSKEYLNSASTPLEVQLLGALPQRSAAFRRSLDAQIAARMEQHVRVQLANGFQIAAPVLLQGVLLAIGVSIAWSTGSLKPGAIIGIYIFVPLVTAPVSQIVNFATNLQMNWVMAAKVGALLDLDTPPPAPARPQGDLPAPTVTLDRVSFAYPGASTPVLRDLSQVFAPGGVTAIVGRSGSGKSSILSLIERVRRPDSGTVRFGDRRVDEIDRASLSAMLAVISQSPVFIDDTLRANFQLAKADVTDREIEESCRWIGIWDKLVRASPEAPFECQIARVFGAGGVLSGGERRLVSVARVLLRRPALLLLDEPTTGVDALSAETLARVVKEAAADKTVILVEHNLDFVMKIADRVCCLADGAFVDVGSPAELAARPSLFRTMLDARDAHTGADIVTERYPLTTLDAMPKQQASSALPSTPRPKAQGAVMAKGMS